MKTRNSVSLALAIVAPLLLVDSAQAYFHPGTGRFISRDPYSETGGLNLFGYVRNRPTFAVDPFGLDIYQAPKPESTKYACGTCGADVTDWMKDEFAAQKAGWDAYKADYQKRTGQGIGWYQYVWWSYHNHYYKNWTKDQWATHPTSGFAYEFNKGTECGTKGDCDVGCGFTVTLCGKCVHTSVLGNLMFGMIAKYAQQSLDDVTKYAQDVIDDYGTLDVYDPPIYKVGYDTFGDYDDFGTDSKFCKTLLKAAGQQGISLEWTGDGNKPPKVSDRSKCKPCSEKTKETRHGGSFPVKPWGKDGRGG